MKKVYALLDPLTHAIHYVGVSRNVESRVYHHWHSRNSTARSPVKDWLCTLSCSPDYFILEEVPDEVAFDAEQYYSEIFRSIGIDLLNLRDGLKMTEIARQRVSDGQRGKPAVNRGKHINMGTSNPSAKLNDDTVRKIRAASGSYASIGVKFGVSKSVVSNIKHRRLWCHVNDEPSGLE